MLGRDFSTENGTQLAGPRSLEAATRLLTQDLDLAPDAILSPSPEVTGDDDPGEADGAWNARFTDHAVSGPDLPLTGSSAAYEGESSESPFGSRLSLEEGTRRIAEALWSLAQAPQEARQRAEKNQERIAEAFDAIGRVSGELCEVKVELAEVRVEVQSGPQREAELRAVIKDLENRLRQYEVDLQCARGEIKELGEFRSSSGEEVRGLKGQTASLEERLAALHETVEGLDGGLKTCSQSLGALSSRCEDLLQARASLEEQQKEQALAIAQLQTDNAHIGSLMDNFVASLRGLDGRVERRRSVDKQVKVVMVGEAETSIEGQVVDASDNGLGLRLSAAVPVGSMIRLLVDEAQILGEVAHCRRRGDTYSAGLRSARQLGSQVSA